MNQQQPRTSVPVPLAEVDFAPAQTGRAGLNAEAVESYRDTEAEWFQTAPVEVFAGGGSYFAGDGWHRGTALLQLGRDRIMAHVTECDTKEEAQRRAVLFALSGKGNRRHGVRLTAADKRAAIRYALGMPENELESDNRIADLCGVSHNTVGTVRNEMTNEGVLSGGARADDPRRNYKPNAKVRGGCHRDETGRVVPNPLPEPRRSGQLTNPSPAPCEFASPPQPVHEAVRQVAPSPPEPLPNLAPEPEAETEHAPAGEQVKDKFGRVVPASLAPLFVAGREHLNRSRRLLREWMQIQQSAALEAWGEGVGMCLTIFDVELSKTATDVSSSIPYCVCPHVNDAGEHELPGNCNVCIRNRGWVSRHTYHQLRESVKQLIIDMGNEPKSEPAPTQAAAPADEFQPFATSSSKHAHTTKPKAGAA